MSKPVPPAIAEPKQEKPWTPVPRPWSIDAFLAWLIPCLHDWLETPKLRQCMICGKREEKP